MNLLQVGTAVGCCCLTQWFASGYHSETQAHTTVIRVTSLYAEYRDLRHSVQGAWHRDAVSGAGLLDDGHRSASDAATLHTSVLSSTQKEARQVDLSPMRLLARHMEYWQ